MNEVSVSRRAPFGRLLLVLVPQGLVPRDSYVVPASDTVAYRLWLLLILVYIFRLFFRRVDRLLLFSSLRWVKEWELVLVDRFFLYLSHHWQKDSIH